MPVNEIQQKNRVVFFFITTSFLLTVARGCVLPYIVLYITAVFEKDITISGVVLTVSSIVGIILSLYSGRLALLRSGYCVLLFLTVGFFVSLMLIPKAGNIIYFTLILISLNLFYSCFEVLLKVFFSNQTIEQDKRRYFSANYLAVNVGWAIGPLIGSLVQKISMEAIFYSASIISIIPLIFMIINGNILSGLTFRSPEYHQLVDKESIYHGGNLPLIWLTVASFLGAFVYGNPIAYLSQFLIKSYPQETVTHIIALMMLVNAATVMIFQHFTVRLLSNKNLNLSIATGTACFIFGLTLFFYASDNFVMWCFGMFFFALGEVIYVPVLFLMTDDLAPPLSRGKYFSVQNLGAAGASLSPLVMGFMFSALSGKYSFVMLAAGVLLSCIIIIRVGQARKNAF